MNSTNTVPTLTTCPRCQNPATLPCVGCQDAPALDPQIHSVSYCTIQCYEADKQTHKATCKQLQARKLFYRAGDVLQEIFYIYKEKIFLKKLLGVEVKNGGDDIHIKIESIDNMTQISRLPTFAELLHTFPGNKCGNAVAWMHDMVKLMLEGVAVNIEEVSLEPKNPKRQIIDVNLKQEGKNDTPHNILKVEIKNGEVCALDLAGAQFGYYDAITPWEEYSNTRVERIIVRDDWEEYRHFGGMKELHMKEVNNMSSVDMFQFSQFAGFNFCASEILDKTTLVWVAVKLDCYWSNV